MNRIIITLTLLTFFLITHAQQTTVVRKEKENYFEEYSVLKSDKRIKHGSYFRLSKPILGGYAFESVGTYSHGQKDGYWETYYRNINNIKDKGFYKNGVKDSIWISFYPEEIARQLVEVESAEGTSLQVLNANPAIAKTGKYKSGSLSGIWEYFDERGVIAQKYDHDRDSLIFLSTGDINNSAAGFIGGEFLLHRQLYDIFDFHGLMSTVNTKISLKSSKIAFKVTIDAKGRLRDIRESENTVNNKKISARALATVQSMDGQWYPTLVNGIPRPTIKTITFKLDVTSTTESGFHANWTFMNTTKGINLTIQVE